MREPVLVQRDDGVGVLSFSRPDRHNALSDELLAAWRAELGRLASDETIGAIVLRGEGPSFSSGRDLAELGRRPEGASDEGFVAREQREALALRRVAKPVVAALKGWVLGGALELALHADVRVAARDARLGLPEVRLGIVPDIGGLTVLHALVGPERTKRLVLGAEPIDAACALEWGLVSEVVEPDALDDVVLDVARSLAARPAPATRAAKALIDALTDDALDASMRRELRAQVELFGLRRRSR